MGFNNKRISVPKDTPSQKRTRNKLSAKTVIALTVDSLLVISAAAIGSVSYYKAANSSVEALLPYKITIGTSAQNADVRMTLHESVADDYTTAYIFSIKGLTDGGKSLLTNNILDDTCQTSFYRDNAGENTDCRLYKLRKQSPTGESDTDIGLRCDGLTDDAVNNVVYAIRPVESLSEADCEYYVLYVISEERQQLSLTFDGLQLLLPEAMTHTPGTEIELGSYIQNYSLTVGGSQITSGYPDDAVVTPLGLYVNGNSQESTFFDHAKFALTDGSEIDFNQTMQGVKDYSPSYYSSDDDKLSVYLFKGIENIQSLKSLVFYDNIEFPIDGGTPFVRSTGRELVSSSNTAILWTIAQRLRGYIAKTCPVSSKTVTKNDWSNVKFGGKDTLCFDVISDRTANKTDRFLISMTDSSGGALEQEARKKAETFDGKLHAAGKEKTLQFNIIKTGTFLSTKLIAVDCGETPSGYTRRCIFAIYNNQLITIQYDSYSASTAFKAFNDLLKLF